MIEEMLAYNREFVRSKGYEKFQTSKFPDKKIAILTCMDTRLVELLPAALGINADMMIRHLIQRGVSQDHIDMMRYCGIDFEAWLRGFDCVENSVAETVDLLRNHPLMPADVTIRGYVINTETGELTPQE